MQIDMLKAQVIMAKAKKNYTSKTIFSGSQISCYQKKLNYYGLNNFFFMESSYKYDNLYTCITYETKEMSEW